MTTTNRKQTPTQARKSALESDYAPLYAVAGLTDVVATTVKETLATTQQRAAKRVSALQSKPAELEHQVEERAKSTADEITKLIKSVPDQMRALPEATKARLVEAQKQAQSYLAEANHTYAELAGRGKRVVDETLITARKLSGQAEAKAEDVFADVADAVDPAFENVQETVTTARKTVTGRSATRTMTPRSTARATANRMAAAERADAEKIADERVAAEKKAARSAAAKRGAANRAAAKQAATETATETATEVKDADAQAS